MEGVWGAGREMASRAPFCALLSILFILSFLLPVRRCDDAVGDGDRAVGGRAEAHGVLAVRNEVAEARNARTLQPGYQATSALACGAVFCHGRWMRKLASYLHPWSYLICILLALPLLYVLLLFGIWSYGSRYQLPGWVDQRIYSVHDELPWAVQQYLSITWLKLDPGAVLAKRSGPVRSPLSGEPPPLYYSSGQEVRCGDRVSVNGVKGLVVVVVPRGEYMPDFPNSDWGDLAGFLIRLDHADADAKLIHYDWSGASGLILLERR